MGECAYYLKAAFRSPAEAQKAAVKIDAFFNDVKEAHEFWQEDRGQERKYPYPESFWVEFKKKFPSVMEYVKTLPDYEPGATSNILAGNLDVGSDENNETLVNGNVVAWGDGCVWHMASWAPLCEFIKNKFGATRVVWDMEENGCGSLDSLLLYDYEGIVNEILKNKALLPLLIGVNEDLDELVEQKLSQKKRKT